MIAWTGKWFCDLILSDVVDGYQDMPEIRRVDSRKLAGILKSQAVMSGDEVHSAPIMQMIIKRENLHEKDTYRAADPGLSHAYRMRKPQR